MRWTPGIAWALALLPGCFLSHPLGVATTSDGGMAVLDARTPRVDAGPERPLPDRPPTDPGPDGRPSDDVGGAWPDPPARDPSAPCCRPQTDEVRIPIDEVAVGDVDLAWSGSGWGVAYSSIDRGVVFRELAPDATARGPLRALSRDGAMGIAVAFRGERFAIVSSREGSGRQTSALALLDRHGVPASEWTPLDLTHGASIAHVAHLDRWLIATTGAIVIAVDRDAESVRRIQVPNGGPAERPQIVGMKSRAVMFYAEAPALMAAVVHPTLEHEPPRTVHLREGLSDPVLDFRSGLATRLRDEAVIIFPAEERSPMFAFDPWRGTLRRADAPPMRADSWLGGRAIGIDELDAIAVCHVAGEEEHVELHLVGSDGAPLGAPVRVTERSGYMRRCALGWSGDTLFVAWNDYYDGSIRVRGYSL